MQFTKHFTHFVVKFIDIHYKKFEMRNINNEQMISKVEPALLILWRQHGLEFLL